MVSRETLKSILLGVVLLVCFLFTSFYGLNFGVNWDEPRAKFDSVRNTLNNGIFLQGGAEDNGFNYNYGGVNYLLTWMGFTPEITDYLRANHWTREALAGRIIPILYGVPARLRVRRIYLVLSSLSIVWLFCLNMRLGRSRVEAFLAAAILAGSWEVAYHSRWIAPDAVVMQFALLCFLCAASTRRVLLWSYVGAAAAGLTIGTKYTGGLVLPFFLAGAAYNLWRQNRSAVHVLKHVVGMTSMAIFIFVVTTPGILIDPFRFFGQLKDQKDIYAEGFFGYTVKPGLPHLWKMTQYFSLQLFSHYWPISVVFAALCAVGFVALLVEWTWLGFLIAAFTAAYIAYFSQQAVMIVRNLLIVAPFLCLASARGITVIANRLSANGKRVVYGAIAALLVVNLGWQVYAADQTKRREHSKYFLDRFGDYVQRHRGNVVLVSAKLAVALQGAGLKMPPNMVTVPNAPHDEVAFLQSEGPDIFWRDWPSNWWGMYKETFGALEVNLDAYSTFVGNERILLTTTDHFKKLPMPQTSFANTVTSP
jgi:hypothetical protein